MLENFRQPYFAISISDFWRRWHISPGNWFKDYLFYPIAVSKWCKDIGHFCRGKLGSYMGKLIPIYIALFCVWTVTGLWHGAAWTYPIWGYINFIVIAVSMYFSPMYAKVKINLGIKAGSKIWKSIQIIRTFILVCFFRFFSRAGEVAIAISMIKIIFEFDGIREAMKTPTIFFPGMEWIQITFFIMGSIFLFIVDIWCESKSWEKVKRKCPYILRCIIYVMMIFSIIFIVGSNDIMEGFIYANF